MVNLQSVLDTELKESVDSRGFVSCNQVMEADRRPH